MTPCAFSQTALGLVNVGGSARAAHLSGGAAGREGLLTGSLLFEELRAQ